MIVTLLDGVSSTGTGTARQFGPTNSAATTGVVQAVLSDADVDLEGSLDGTNWFSITTLSSTTGDAVTLPQWVRGNVTRLGGGSVTLLLQTPGDWVEV